MNYCEVKIMHDAHFHFSKEIVQLQKEYSIQGICNVANLKEYDLVKEQDLFYSCGVHPWQASLTLFDQMLPIMEKASIIGEIGMDSVWCDVSLNVQKEVFIKQIQFAYEKKKPVILHTKGQEKEILDVIKKYPNTYIVHWYGCMDYLSQYNQVASYFTIGPSIQKEEAVRQVVQNIFIEKLLLETDGMDAVKWAVGHTDYLRALEVELQETARIKGIPQDLMEKILDDNFHRLAHNG